ncbi:hypothetical protein [Turneriella parva]|uniref:Lipoprotein n=1 Tax=Turneriella parva (strain ATCC BAA-1111 / DSM 21527 / NCTC 11395 / H) TaxID=869212 RepID=I4B9Y1_TURPD|nr:hypothetical protein [Turneriella parva]AFM14088.1 hypothetical protein Turpa_3451 [Turneriella parva DSM 21527]
MKPIKLFRSISISAALILSACWQNTATTINSGECPGASDLDKQIQAIISDKTCITVQDCAYKAYGYKHCGGPSSYLIYSKKNINETELLQKVDGYNSIIEKCVKDSKMSGTCDTPMTPNLSCDSGTCKDKGYSPN